MKIRSQNLFNIRQPTHSPIANDIIVSAEKLSESGEFHASISTLSRLNPTTIVKDELEYLNARKSLGLAKNYFHLYQDKASFNALSCISENVLKTSKSIASNHSLIIGLLAKRASYNEWKSGNLEEAKKCVKTAIAFFQSSQYEAEIEGLDLTKFNAHLNEIYAKNLSIKIDGNDDSKSSLLARDAVICVGEIIKHAPQVLRNHATDLTIVVDICSTIYKNPLQIYKEFKENLHFTSSFQSFLDINHSWSSALIKAAEEENKQDIKARALVLATKLTNIEESDNLHKIGVHLLDYLLDCQGKRGQSETPLTSNVRKSISLINEKSKIKISRRIFR